MKVLVMEHHIEHSFKHFCKFSIIIPTRERADTLYACLLTVTKQEYPNFEILVSDNFSQDNTRLCVESFHDSRIKYVNTGQRLSMTDNWEFALQHITGDWVTMLGDDDGLMPLCLQKVNTIIKETGTQAIKSVPCTYYWPTTQQKTVGMPLNVPMGTGFKLRSTSVWLDKVLSGQVSYGELPILYHGGFLDAHVIRDYMKNQTHFFKSRIPDVYSGILLAHILENYIYSYEPLVINGTSSHSTGQSQFGRNQSTHHEALTPVMKFTKEPNLPFHPSIPETESGNLPKSILAIIYESYAQVCQVLHLESRLTPESKLRNILASQRDEFPDMKSWVEKYCALHHLKLSQIERGLVRCRFFKTLHFYKYRLTSIFNTYFFYDHHQISQNVYDASIQAATIRSMRPYRWVSVFRTVIRILKRR